MITISLVTYTSNFDSIRATIDSLNSITAKKKIFIVNNYLNDDIRNPILSQLDCEYIWNPKNPGYGASHNLAIKKAFDYNYAYHLIINPDIEFEKGVIEKLINFMEENTKIGLVMPKIKYKNGNVQYLCKLLPTPLDLFFRRFQLSKRRVENRNKKYELRFTGYNKTIEVPSLSGCFMFVRTSVLKKVGGFDERFFMYLEDVDLSRRIGQISKTVYFPSVEVIHNYEKGSYKNIKLLFYHISSAIKYFNKWGWFFDKKRKKINHETLKKLNYT